MKNTLSEALKVTIAVSIAFNHLNLVVAPSVKPLEYGTSNEFNIPVFQLMSVFEHEVYSGIPLFCADSIQSAVSLLASLRLCASMTV